MKYKYPRTPHFEFSPGVSSDDRINRDLSSFENQEVVISLKMDGENSNLYSDHYHARSLDSKDHPSRHWLKGLWGKIKYLIPEDWRICGENLYAKHSIKYTGLPSYFMVFSIWNDKNECLSIDDTLEWCVLLGLEHVPIVWRGTFDLSKIKQIVENLDFEKNEGIVVRLAKSFSYDDFDKSVIKYVRSNHVNTDDHWMFSKVEPNELK